MATINQIIVAIMGPVMSWLYLGVFIFLFIKFFQMIASFGGDSDGKGWWPFGKKGKGKKGKSGKDGTSGKDGPDGGDGPDGPEGDDPDKKDKKSKKEIYDEAAKNPGHVKVRVTGSDNQPLKDVNVEVYPSKFKIVRKKIFSWVAKHYTDVTNARGIAPKNNNWWDIPSVTHKVKITYKIPDGKEIDKDFVYRKTGGWDSVSVVTQWLYGGMNVTYDKNKKWLTAKRDEEIPRDSEKIIEVTLPVKGERAYSFRPIIRDAKHDGEKLHTLGYIK